MGQETISAKFGRYSKSGHEDAPKGASEHDRTSSHAPTQSRPWDLTLQQSLVADHFGHRRWQTVYWLVLRHKEVPRHNSPALGAVGC